MGQSKNGKLQGKVAAITGGGGVLCGHFARTLAMQGVSVAVLDLNLESAQAVVDSILATGGEAKAYKANVLEKEVMKQVAATVLADYGPCDILINGAGGNHPAGTTSEPFFDAGQVEAPDIKSFFDLEVDGVDFVFKLNFLGTLIPTQAFAKQMLGREGSTVLNISSMNAFTPLTKIPAYSGAKAAISNFTQWLAVHFSKTGIRVNAMAPGFFLTQQNERLLLNPDGSLTARGNQIIEQTPLGKFGKPGDLDSTLLWLCDPSSSFITGVVVPIDGGFSAYSGV
ncbi:MAG: SDR family oxidoreductase [Bacteroidota bacterium]